MKQKLLLITQEQQQNQIDLWNYGDIKDNYVFW